MDTSTALALIFCILKNGVYIFIRGGRYLDANHAACVYFELRNPVEIG
jgi:hypothetical protein